jgi:hypothetical protein
MHNTVKIEGSNSLVRDTSSMAILVSDPVQKQDYLTRRSLAAARHDEIQNQKQELDEIKNEMREIKNMLLNLLQR